MPTYQCRCEQCGVAFTARRSSSQAPPRFCSQKCNGASRGRPSVHYDTVCACCGVSFTAKRPAGAPPPKYCSGACYSAAGRSVRDVMRKATVRRRRAVTRIVDGKPVSMTRARWVWNEQHPNDPVGPDEHIHHLDGDRLNDSPANLVKVSAREHRRLHSHLPAEQVTRMSALMSAYHAANPGKQRAGSPKACPVCGVEFYRPPSAKAITCSRQCMSELRSMKSNTT